MPYKNEEEEWGKEKYAVASQGTRRQCSESIVTLSKPRTLPVEKCHVHQRQI